MLVYDTELFTSHRCNESDGRAHGQPQQHMSFERIHSGPSFH